MPRNLGRTFRFRFTQGWGPRALVASPVSLEVDLEAVQLRFCQWETVLYKGVHQKYLPPRQISPPYAQPSAPARTVSFSCLSRVCIAEGYAGSPVGGPATSLRRLWARVRHPTSVRA